MLIEKYLDYLQEFREKPEIKNSRGFVYLFHGTRMPTALVKRRGLTMAHNASADARIKGDGIWFTSSEKYAVAYTKEKIFTKKRKGIVLLCKLEMKYLEFVERPLFLFDEYVYRKDISPKDIIIEGDSKFSKIVMKLPYLKGK